MISAKSHSLSSVTSFWNWVQKNEAQIVNALLLGIETDAGYFQLRKRLHVVSKRIDFLIALPQKSPGSLRIIFTCFGRPQLFGKITALEQQVPLTPLPEYPSLYPAFNRFFGILKRFRPPRYLFQFRDPNQ